MSLEDWLKAGRLAEHESSSEEMADLFSVVERDLRDCRVPGLSSDRRFQIAYNAALQSATVALAATGYRACRQAHHVRVIESPAFTIGADRSLIRRFDRFRRKRNIGEYDRAGTVSNQEVEEMKALAEELRDRVRQWLAANYPRLLSDE